MRVLLVEDDQYLVEILVENLVHQNYTVDVAIDGILGWEKAQKISYDLIILDVDLPRLDGISLCKRLRSQNITTPILLLTACNQREDKVKGFDAGADHYVVKPLDLQELSARIRALLRRRQQAPPTLLEWEQLRLNLNTCEVTYQGKPLNLTPKEYGLLELFLKHHQRVFSLDVIIEKLWDLEETPTENTVRAHIKGLRNKLKIAGIPGNVIETVYGLGYRLKQPSSPQPEPKKISAKSLQHQPKLNQAIVQIWKRYQTKICDRITILEEFYLSLQQGKPDQNLRRQAQQEAHKLAGSLGTFGLGRGSVLAREIEQLCESPTLTSEQIPHFKQLVFKLRQEVEHNAPHSPPLPPENPNLPLIKSSHQVWILSQDHALTQGIQTASLNLGIDSQILTEQSVLSNLKKTSQNPPNFPIVFLDFDYYHSYELVTKLTEQTPSIPVIVLTEQKNFTQRVKVSQAGGKAFLQKPVTSEQINKVIMDVLRQSCTLNAKVLIVDDDSQILEAFQALLEPWGIQTFLVEDPRHFWESLETTNPDLLILDIEMPYLDGIELCQVVRADPRWKSLPVIFLTSHTNGDMKHQVFLVGADDYLTKTTAAPLLVNRILNRLRRTQSLRDSSGNVY